MTTKASSSGWIVPSRSSSSKAMGSWVSFNFFLEGGSPGHPFASTMVSTLLLLDTRVPLEVAWMTSITRLYGKYNTCYVVLDGSLPILFGHRKYGSFLIQSTILCTGSLNVTFTSPIYASGSWILESFRGLNWKPPCRGLLMIGALPLLCLWSSFNLLYSSIRLINCLNKRSSISVIIMELPVILDQIAISG